MDVLASELSDDANSFFSSEDFLGATFVILISVPLADLGESWANTTNFCCWTIIYKHVTIFITTYSSYLHIPNDKCL